MLEPSLAASIDNLAIRARLVVEGALSGLHRARQHGASVEFSQHKEYSPGDEIRHIDWKMYAKADRYYVKQFEQESQQTAYLLLDASGSMGFQGGGEQKLWYAAQLVAALAYVLIRQRDYVGLGVLGGALATKYIPPRTRPTHLRDIFTMLQQTVDLGATGDASVTQALSAMMERGYRRRSLIVIVSDMLEVEEQLLVVLRRLKATQHDVVIFHTLDPHELALPYEGMTLFSALEGEQRVLVNPAAIRSRYMRQLTAFLQRLHRGCIDFGIEYHLISTEQVLEKTLRDFLLPRCKG